MLWRLSLLLAAMMLTVGYGQTVQTSKPAPPASCSRPASGGAPYIVYRPAGKITLDGKYHADEWTRAGTITDFYIPVRNCHPTQATAAQLLWDDDYLYLNIHADDNDIQAKFKQRTDPLWEDDNLELFMKPSAEKPAYYEFEVTPLNTVMALAIAGPREKPASEQIAQESNWEHGVKSWIIVEEKTAGRDAGWRLIMAIPWKNLANAGRKAPAAGDRWSFNLCRTDHSKYLPKSPELSAAVPLSKVSFHLLAEYGTMVFEK